MLESTIAVNAVSNDSQPVIGIGSINEQASTITRGWGQTSSAGTLFTVFVQCKVANKLPKFWKPFGGVNVIIIGDFHQFPPIAGGKNVPLFWPCNPSKDNAEKLLGRKLYEEFRVVVQLKEQVLITDPDWVDLLQHVSHGSCYCPSIDFTVPPWNKAVLVTPHHSICQHWNAVMAQAECRRNGTQLLICPAYVLIKLNHTKAVQLEGLEKNIILLVPMERTFTVIHGNHPKSIR
ncbi:hypothetical protein BDR03DRAFT_983103 [Suillus americanus]|nr:hypothetical protein BDR03DRAFT_983103 [Suillus americanus]